MPRGSTGLSLLAAAALLALAAPRSAAARPWGARHLRHAYAGAQASALFVTAQVTGYESGYLGQGGGGGVALGYRFGPYFALEVNWLATYQGQRFNASPASDGGVLGSFYLMAFTADAKIVVPTHRQVEPFFQLGIGYAFVGATYAEGYEEGSAIFAQGLAAQGGGGLDIYLSSHVSLVARVLYRGLYLGVPSFKVGFDHSNFASAISVDFGATYHF